MLSTPHRQRIDRRCAVVLIKAIDSFPALLADSEPDKAAAIVADLIKFQLAIKEEQANPGEALAEVIRQVTEADKHNPPPDRPQL